MRSWGAVLISLLGGVACVRATRGPCDHPPPVYVELVGGEGLNPSDTGAPLTTQVLVLQLSSTGRYEQSEFLDVWQRAKDVLGEELLERHELTLEPGGRTVAGFGRNPKATHVGVVGVFRQPSGTAWRGIQALPLSDDACPERPVPVRPAPERGDTVLRYYLDDYRVDTRPPGARAMQSGRSGEENPT